MQRLCGNWVSVTDAQCGAVHFYKRYCKTAGCQVDGCAEARQRLHVRRLMCVDFDFSKPLMFLTLTCRNVDQARVDDKSYRQARIKAIKTLMKILNVANWIVAHEITRRKGDVRLEMHYHHHIIYQPIVQFSSDVDMTSHIFKIWQSLIPDFELRLDFQVLNYTHAVNLQELSCENSERLCKYLCKYLSKDAKKNYHPIGMQSFQRHGSLVDREFEYEMLSGAMVEARSVKTWRNVKTIAFDYSSNDYHAKYIHTKGNEETHEIKSHLGSDKIINVCKKTQVIVVAKEILKVKVLGHKRPKLDEFGKKVYKNNNLQFTSDYFVEKGCVNCHARFHENEYTKNLLVQVLSEESLNKLCQKMEMIIESSR